MMIRSRKKSGGNGTSSNDSSSHGQHDKDAPPQQEQQWWSSLPNLVRAPSSSSSSMRSGNSSSRSVAATKTTLTILGVLLVSAMIIGWNYNINHDLLVNDYSSYPLLSTLATTTPVSAEQQPRQDVVVVAPPALAVPAAVDDRKPIQEVVEQQPPQHLAPDTNGEDDKQDTAQSNVMNSRIGGDGDDGYLSSPGQYPRVVVVVEAEKEVLPTTTNSDHDGEKENTAIGANYYPVLPLLYSNYSSFLIRTEGITTRSTTSRKRKVEPLSDNLKMLLNEMYYDSQRYPPLDTEECKAQYAWQTTTIPACNSVHEVRQIKAPHLYTGGARYIASGVWRDVWTIADSGGTVDNKNNNTENLNNDNMVILKTIRWKRAAEMNEKLFEKQRKDGIIMERLQGEPMILDIYGFCGVSGLFEFAPGGDLEKNTCLKKDKYEEYCLEPANVTNLELLHMGVQMAMSVAALHNFDKEGIPSVAHADIDGLQFVKKGDIFKLNDFNLAKLIPVRRNGTESELCTFTKGDLTRNGPPEQLWDAHTAKTDVYAMGSLIYELLTKHRVFAGVSRHKAWEMLKKGDVPDIPDDALEPPGDPSLMALREALKMCWIYDVEKRATARQVEIFLKERLEEIDPGRLESWMKTLSHQR